MSKPVVLVVDDNPVVRTLLGSVLTRAGFGVRTAASGEAALTIYERDQEAIQLVMLDIQLGEGIDGPATLAALREIDPEVRCCFMSADTGRYSIEQLNALGSLAFFPKPFTDVARMMHRLRGLIEAPSIRRSA
jgi:CheY-like chemotaxis protein